MSKLSRTKGAKFEREVAIDLREIWPDAKRGLQSRGGGAEVADVIGVPFHVECKHGVQPSPRAALYQAQRDTQGLPPVAIIKDNGCKAFVVLPYSDWLQLVREWHTGREVPQTKEIDHHAPSETRQQHSRTQGGPQSHAPCRQHRDPGEE